MTAEVIAHIYDIQLL